MTQNDESIPAKPDKSPMRSREAWLAYLASNYAALHALADDPDDEDYEGAQAQLKEWGEILDREAARDAADASRQTADATGEEEDARA